MLNGGTTYQRRPREVYISLRDNIHFSSPSIPGSIFFFSFLCFPINISSTSAPINHIHCELVPKMFSNFFGALRQKLRNPHFEAKGTAHVHGKDNWLDNDDIRPLRLADRTWNIWTYLTFWFSASVLKILHPSTLW